MIPALLAQINPSHWPTYVVFLIFVLVGFAIILCIFLAKYFNLWIQAKMTWPTSPSGSWSGCRFARSIPISSSARRSWPTRPGFPRKTA